MPEDTQTIDAPTAVNEEAPMEAARRSAEPKPKPAPEGKKSATRHLVQSFCGVGRRKTSTARVRILPGSGQVAINGVPLDGYFPSPTQRTAVRQPLELVAMLDKLDVEVNARGGGFTGQAGAVAMGVARALTEMNPEFRAPLGKAGFLTRDSRQVERKKVGRRKARRGFQWCKR